MKQTVCSLGQILVWNASVNKDRIAIVDIDKDISVTFVELNERVNKIANGLLNSGLQPGDNVAVLSFNCIEYIEIYLAASKINVIPVPVNYRLTPYEIEYILKDSQAKVLFYGEEFEEVVETVENNMQLEQYYKIEQNPADKKDHLFANEPASEPEAVADVKGCLFKGYTSGTTGFPKGCVNIHEVFVDHFKRYALLYKFDEDDRQIVSSPLFHEAPYLLAFTQLIVGGSLYVIKRFDAERVLRVIQDNKISNTGFMVPVMIEGMLQNGNKDKYDVSSLESVIIAGAPLHHDTTLGAIDYFSSAKIHEFYGATEVGIMTDVVHNEHLEKGTTCGRPLLGTYMGIFDDDCNELPSGEVGTVYSTGTTLISEYFNKPKETEEATLIKDGVRWFTLGDAGYIDEDGFLYLVDRKKNLIISGGENIYPAEIENVLKTHPAVFDVAVMGVPDERWGEVPKAYVQIKPEWNQELSEEDIIKTCENKIAKYKYPKYVLFVPEIPRNESGKILRNTIKERYGQSA